MADAELRFKIEEWLKYAKRDLDSANFLCGMIPVPIEIICFHCQQSAEKSLKAFIVSKGIEPKKTHDLVDLQNTCNEYDDFNSLTVECVMLRNFGVQPRYPFALQIEEEDMKAALKMAEKIYDFVSEKLNQFLEDKK